MAFVEEPRALVEKPARAAWTDAMQSSRGIAL
jgi:hypothetical protein